MARDIILQENERKTIRMKHCDIMTHSQLIQANGCRADIAHLRIFPFEGTEIVVQQTETDILIRVINKAEKAT